MAGLVVAVASSLRSRIRAKQVKNLAFGGCSGRRGRREQNSDGREIKTLFNNLLPVRLLDLQLATRHSPLADSNDSKDCQLSPEHVA